MLAPKFISGGSDSKKSARSARDTGSIPGSGRSPREGNSNPQGQRSLVGYSPWGHKELDMTERTGFAQSLVAPVATACSPAQPSSGWVPGAPLSVYTLCSVVS